MCVCMRTDGAHRHVCGGIASIHEAALIYARHLGPERSAQVAAAADRDMGAAEACKSAAAEGLALMRSSNASGFFGVKLIHVSPPHRKLLRYGLRQLRRPKSSRRMPFGCDSDSTDLPKPEVELRSRSTLGRRFSLPSL